MFDLAKHFFALLWMRSTAAVGFQVVTTVLLIVGLVLSATAPSEEANQQACRAISALRRQQSPETMAAVERQPDDWVALEYLGAALGAVARGLLAEGVEVEAQREREGSREAAARELLEEAARMFERAHEARGGAGMLTVGQTEGQIAGEGEGEPRKRYPQLAFAQPATLALRGWGDAVAWLGRERQAREVFSRGVALGMWRSPQCRPEREIDTVLPAEGRQFFFDPLLFPQLTPLLEGLSTIQTELHILQINQEIKEQEATEHETKEQEREETNWRLEKSGLHSQQSWKELVLMVDGELDETNCRGPFQETCQLLGLIPPLRLRNGQVKLSAMRPGTRVRPHCGPVNSRLRMHCALVAPALRDGADSAWIRVGDQRRGWRQGECFVFEEACEHQVLYDPPLEAGPRVVLIADFANPFVRSPQEYLHAHRDIDKNAAVAILQSHRQFHRAWRVISQHAANSNLDHDGVLRLNEIE